MMSQAEIEAYDLKHQARLREQCGLGRRERTGEDGRLVCAECKSPGRHRTHCSRHVEVPRPSFRSELQGLTLAGPRVRQGMIGAEIRRRAGG